MSKVAGSGLVPGRFLITSWDGGGNTTPAYHLAMRLLRRGHDALIVGWPSMADRTRRDDIPFAPYPDLPPWPDGVDLDAGDFTLMREMTNGPKTEAGIVEVAASLQPDVLVVDCMMAAGFRAAATLALPTSVLCHVLYGPFYDLWADFHLETPVKPLFAEVDQVLVCVAPGLEAGRELPGHTRFVGPICHPDADGAAVLGTWELDALRTPGPPWVLVSLSSTPMGQDKALGPILEALASQSIRVLLTLGDVVTADGLDIPENVFVRSFVPHDFVLPYMDLVVSHGGLSTINAALVAGKPLVCIPQGRDQTFNAAQVEWCGAGRQLAKDASAAEIGGVVDEVLRSASFREAAERLAAQSRPLGGGAVATDLVEGLLRPGAGR